MGVNRWVAGVCGWLTPGVLWYFGAADSQGPITRRLATIGPILGIAAGRFGQLSESGHALVLAVRWLPSNKPQCILST